MQINLTTADFILSIIASLLASIGFLYLILTYLRPKIEISRYVIKISDFDDPTTCAFCFKILNKSKHTAFDIRLELCLLKRIAVGAGLMDTRRTPLKLKRDFISHLEKRISNKKIKTVSFAHHALIFRTFEDLDKILNDENHCIELQVSLRHGLTGLGKVFKQEFTKSSLSNRSFAYGNSLDLA